MKRKRVTLEPELEALAVEWDGPMRAILAKKFKRWSRQLDLSAQIMAKDLGYVAPKRLRFVSVDVAKGN
ncbi:MAG: hypothetical protein JWR19_4515 [Pedosphaera sp.]|nr:hypothetical protein [Pedosphaera sp.]